MVYIDPQWILVEFLRRRLIDPRARAEATNTENLIASGSQSVFLLTAPSGKVSCIISVTVNSVPQVKWKDYYIEFESEDIVFFTALSDADAVAVEYKYGTTNWIFPGKPVEKLGLTSFPRMNTLIAGDIGKRLGSHKAPIEDVMRIQLDIWAKEKQNGQIFTIDSKTYTGEKLAKYLGYQARKAFRDNEGDLSPALYGYDNIGGILDLAFNSEMQCHHKALEFDIRGLDVGEL